MARGDYIFQFSIAGKRGRPPKDAVSAFWVNKQDRSLPWLMRVRTPQHNEEIRQNMNAAMRDLRRNVEGIYKLYAPVRTGQLRRKVAARIDYRGGVIKIMAYSGARDGRFAYTPVTRFGHEQHLIFPRRAKMLVFPGRRGGKIVKPFVRGYHPKSDWVTDADALVAGAITRADQRMGRKVQEVILKG